MNELILPAVIVECDRQHVGVERHQPLLESWALARAYCEAGEKLTVERLCNLAGIGEPDNQGRLRATPVTFMNGGSSATPAQVEPLVTSLINDHWEEAFAEKDGLARQWLREFLWIHPFSDGNGRLGWVLQQWLFETWDAPEVLIDFGW